jgi:hypothetical protein
VGGGIAVAKRKQKNIVRKKKVQTPEIPENLKQMSEPWREFYEAIRKHVREP